MELQIEKEDKNFDGQNESQTFGVTNILYPKEAANNHC